MENPVFFQHDSPDGRRGIDVQGLEFTQVKQPGD
jgi:hypothetical protein